MTHVLDWAIVVNAFGIGLVLGAALCLFVISTTVRVMLRLRENDVREAAR